MIKEGFKRKTITNKRFLMKKFTKKSSKKIELVFNTIKIVLMLQQ